jgi:hypothetical protein
LWEDALPTNYDREQIRDALAATDPAFSFYLDLETGQVLRVPDIEESAEAEALRNEVMDGYGARYRYVPGGKTNPTETDIDEWLEAEGL